MRAWDSHPDVRQASGWDGYLVGPFEDTLTELGGRVLRYDIDENDWRVWPEWPEPAEEPQPCSRCRGTGLEPPA